jgi:hypothetical protein
MVRNSQFYAFLPFHKRISCCCVGISSFKKHFTYTPVTSTFDACLVLSNGRWIDISALLLIQVWFGSEQNRLSFKLSLKPLQLAIEYQND